MEYNTTRNHLIMKEYGRNIQKMVEYLLSIEDRDQRQANAMAVIELMGTLNPHLRNVEDFRHKLWDHLFLISGFTLDVESPYPIPTSETLRARPDPLPYPKKYPKNRHFGRNLEMVIDKALHEENPEKKEGFTQTIGNYMKLAYTNWHKESVHDDAIRSELSNITQGQLDFQAGVVPPAPVQNTAPFGNSIATPEYRAPKRKNFQQNKFKSNNGGKSNNNNNGNNKHSNNKYKNRNK